MVLYVAEHCGTKLTSFDFYTQASIYIYIVTQILLFIETLAVCKILLCIILCSAEISPL